MATTRAARLSRPISPALDLSALGLPAEPGSLYELALTHRSFAFEQPEPLPHNERLELLGDAILGAIVTALIFRRYPHLSEGEMARLRSSVVSTSALAAVARDIGLGPHIRLGHGEASTGGRDKASLLADTFEALVGAAYLEQGIEALGAALEPLFEARIERSVATGGGCDPKTTLQELVVRDHGERPAYRISSSGPDHDKRFTAEVFVEDQLVGAGAGRSKKEAEQRAAERALERLRPPVSAGEIASNGAGARAPAEGVGADAGPA